MNVSEILLLWAPPARLPLSEWAEKHLVLSSEYSARSGPIKLFEYQRAIFDAFTDDSVRELVLMCSTQMVKTLLIQAATAHTIAENPLPILIVQPKDDAAKKFSKRRIGAMLRDCPILQGKVSDTGPGKEGTLQERFFAGGSLSIVGAGSPTNLASASIGVLLLDEIDKYDLNVGGHGDPIAQARARLSTYGSRSKLVAVCSPTNEHTSRIARLFNDSDQREAFVPCPHCSHFQNLIFAQVRWNNKLATSKDKAATARYDCISCGNSWNDLERWRACEKLEWRRQKPFAGVAGFHISHIYSPWHKLSDIVTDFLRSQNDWTERKTFINNSLAELWKVDGIAPDETKLFARRETYPHTDEAVVPIGGVFLTAAVDVQLDRLECEVRAWGRNKESWSVGYEVVQVYTADGHTPLPTTDERVWDELDRRILQKEWAHESGGSLPLYLMAIDTGHNAQVVYEYCLKHPQPLYTATGGMRVRAVRSVVPVKGNDDELKLISTISTENAARKRQGIRIVSIGTHAAKSEIYDNLRNVLPRAGEAVPNCVHFPQYELDYFKGLCSEHRQVKPNGSHEWVKKPNVRNEPLDLAVYNRGAAALLGIDRFQERHWATLESNITPLAQIAVDALAPAAPVQNPAKPVGNPAIAPPPRRGVRRFNL